MGEILGLLARYILRVLTTPIYFLFELLYYSPSLASHFLLNIRFRYIEWKRRRSLDPFKIHPTISLIPKRADRLKPIHVIIAQRARIRYCRLVRGLNVRISSLRTKMKTASVSALNFR